MLVNTRSSVHLTLFLGSVNPLSIQPDKDGNYPAIIHYAGLPANNLVGSINGLLSGVLAYAGVQLFVEFLAEMRRPRDFLKVGQTDFQFAIPHSASTDLLCCRQCGEHNFSSSLCMSCTAAMYIM